MKQLLIIIACVALTIGNSVFAQQPNNKWGKPSPVEWSLQAWGEAPDAEAVILNKTMTLTYKITRQFESYGNTTQEINMSNVDQLGINGGSQYVLANYVMKVRTKILKDEGAKYANIDIIYFNEESDPEQYDELGRLSVIRYDMNEKGKSQRHVVKNSTFTEERLDAHYVVRHILVPDAKKGDIIEYQYEISSRRVNYLYDWSFQEDIPVLYAKSDMDIPAFIQFNMTTPIHPFITSKVEAGTIFGEQGAGDMKAPKSYQSNHYVVEGHDILPKGLDLQRKADGTEAAKISAEPGQVLRTYAVIKNNVNMPFAMPTGKVHLMINPKK